MVKKIDAEFQVTACGQCSTTVQDFALHPQKLYIYRENVWEDSRKECVLLLPQE